jgi:8-oxo-dGTP diphosphatase
MKNKPFNHCPICGSELNIRSIEGRPRLFCPSCGWIRYENPLPCAAAFVRNSAGDILLIKRGVEPGYGRWALPSGFIEIEETPEMACLRELEEETGLKGRITGFIGVYSQESSVYKRVIIIGYEVKASGDIKAGSDSLAAEYFAPHELPEVAFSTHRQMIGDGVKAAKR